MKAKLLLVALIVPTFVALNAQNFGSRTLVTPSDDNLNSVTFEDLDDDGDLDIVGTTDPGSQVVWYKNLGNSVFSQKIVINSNYDEPRSLRILDIDEDGKNDLVVAEYLEGLSWIKNMGEGFFGSKQSLPYNSSISSLAIGDVDNDGKKDIIVAELSNDILSWIKNQGNGVFNGTTMFYNPADGININTYAFSDTDADGINELIVTTGGSNSQAIIQFEYVNNVFVQTPLFTAGENPPLYQSYLVDLDNDGKTDVIAVSESCGLLWFKNFGANTFSTGNPVGLASCNLGQLRTIGDLDMDGLPDFTYAEDNNLFWRENLAAGDISTTLTPISLDEITGDIVNTQLIDIDDDGDLDVFYRTNEEFGWFKNNHSELAISDVATVTSSFYPNPVSDELHIRSSAGFSSYKIYDITGKMIGHNNLSTFATDYTIDVNGLVQGLYFLEISSESFSKTQKFIKK
ncbi:MAG TPA: T9SS type A sorting domain-containing protein [Flavobacterium sp.]|jgi:hypothetical protein